MAPSVSLWFCLCLSLLVTDSQSVKQHDSDETPSQNEPDHLRTKQRRAVDTGPSQNLDLPEMLDLDQHRRLESADGGRRGGRMGEG